MSYNCKYCDKIYKSNSARIFHYKQKHHDEYEIDKLEIEKNKKEYKCNKCDNIFNSKYSKYYHSKKCKIDIINNSKNEITELRESVSELKETIMNLSNQLHSNSIINNINNINNGIINNGNIYNIVAFDKEDIEKLLTKKELLQILKRGNKALEESISLIHLNKNRLELNNIIITDLTDSYAYIFDGNKFIAKYKEEVLNDLIDKHANIIETTFEKYKDFITDAQQNNLINMFKKLDDDHTPFYNHCIKKKFQNYKEYKTEEAKLIIYNYGNGSTINVEFGSNK